MFVPAGQDPTVREAKFQFIFPFSLEQHCLNELREVLLQDDFIPFQLGDLALEDSFYGPHNRASHRDLERYYLPFTNPILFPDSNDPEAFRRLSKSMNIRAELKSKQIQVKFTVHSIDVFLCPFDTGFLTVRVEMDCGGDSTYGQALEFADRMRHLQDINKLDRNTYVLQDETKFEEVEDFVFQVLAPHLPAFLDRTPMEGTHFEKLPFFMDERMFVMAFFAFSEDEEITLTHRYRAARMDGLDLQGNARVGASHPPYMEDYCRRFGYDRWAPNTYYLTDEGCFSCLTRETPETARLLANQMYGEYYYGLLLNLFHRIVLLKLSLSYSRVQLERKQEQTDDLIRDITSFSAKYYFVEIVSQTQGRELFTQIRSVYGNDKLFEDVKQTLNDLYQYQENRAAKQSSYLLTILTIYTVISGIYGMNQVIEDFKGDFSWTVVREYSLFQWIALVVTFSGLTVAFLLVLNVMWKWTRDFIRRQQS
ncbi:hypothetical protein SD71_08585 [Cohnella kolymensis]|uniref:CorA-like Mg2+ transporter protein n=1 Tax=Cohnella kolymensis TaxID=1590652 RepID=A0ABR5A7D2_9BACL|nr:hypothetical protein [Cohnella kolymensis]KIL36312.1 hypothetical protein SD71_08585 [Cohnella kolymensis]